MHQSMTLGRVDPSDIFRGGEAQFEMIPLTVIGHVHETLRVELGETILERGHVGRIVPVSAVGLLKHEGDAKTGNEDALGPSLLDFHLTGLDEFVDDRWNLGIVERFPDFGEGNVETVVHLDEFFTGDVAQYLPYFSTFRISRLELDDVPTGRFLEIFVVVEPFLGVLIKHGQIADRTLGRLVILMKIRKFLLQVLNQHTELRPPIADVIDPFHLAPDVLQHSTDGFADNGRTQMTDVHLLGDVGRRKVHDAVLRLHGRFGGHPGGNESVHVALEETRLDATHYESRSVHVQAIDHQIIVGHRRDNGPRHLLGSIHSGGQHPVLLELLKQRHGRVALIISKFELIGFHHLGQDVVGRGEGTFNGRRKDRFDRPNEGRIGVVVEGRGRDEGGYRVLAPDEGGGGGVEGEVRG
mmetsp:Transcript_44615/g.136100  ORF Transcript_44615/g.136100 Transcript_44615/m.136100 type:complete len:411 (-) Transcript_44615:772-2004(-)